MYFWLLFVFRSHSHSLYVHRNATDALFNRYLSDNFVVFAHLFTCEHTHTHTFLSSALYFIHLLGNQHHNNYRINEDRLHVVAYRTRKSNDDLIHWLVCWLALSFFFSFITFHFIVISIVLCTQCHQMCAHLFCTFYVYNCDPFDSICCGYYCYCYYFVSSFPFF